MPVALFLFAHPDDEFGLFSKIELEAANGACCIYLTNGSHGGQDPEVRKAETVNVLKILGLSPNDLYFLGIEKKIPDGRLYEYLDSAFKDIKSYFDPDRRMRALYIPAWEGGHQDHDAVHLIGLAIAHHFKIMDNCYQFSLYHGKNLPGPFFRVMSPLGDNGPVSVKKIVFRKRLHYLNLCFQYPSQFKTWIGLFPFVFFHYFIHGHQYLQTTDLHRVNDSPHNGILLYERRGFLKESIFTSATRPFVQKRIMRKLQADSSR